MLHLREEHPDFDAVLSERAGAAVRAAFNKLAPMEQNALKYACKELQKEDLPGRSPIPLPLKAKKGIYFHISLCYWLLTFIFLVFLNTYLSFLNMPDS